MTTETEQKSLSARHRSLIWLLGLLSLGFAVVIGYSLFNQDLPSQAGVADFDVSGQIELAAPKGFTLIPDQQGDFVTLSATPDATVKDKVGSGALLELSTKLEEKFSGRRVAINISARSSSKNGADHLSAAYFTAGVGNSGWQYFSLELEFSEATFEFPVPKRTGEPGKDYLGFVPGEPGQGGSVDIQSIRIRILD